MSRLRLQDLEHLVGKEVGTTEWHVVDQQAIDIFAEATGDRQWIHIDPVRAAEGPYGATIAHGYLTLSLLPVLVQEAFSVDGVSRRVNYGLDRVRFPRPVTVNSKIRAVVTVREVREIEGGVQLGLRVVVEVQDGGKPACVADTVTLLLR